MGFKYNVSPDMGILVVDDFGTMRRIVKKILLGIGFRNIVEAENGKEGLRMVRNGGIEFIVSDWNMPEMMGIDFLREVRADPKFKEVPFLMVTAENQKENVMEAVQCGVTNYIVKPFTAETLEEKLDKIFKPAA